MSHNMNMNHNCQRPLITERSIAGMRLSYRLEINDRTGEKNCLALHCKRPTSYCTVKDYECDAVLPYFCPNLWVIGDANCPQHFNEYQRYKHMEPKFRSCYSKARFTWSDAMKLNECGGSNYTDFTAITEAINDYIYLNSTSKYYWFGAGRYSCETGEISYLQCIRKNNLNTFFKRNTNLYCFHPVSLGRHDLTKIFT